MDIKFYTLGCKVNQYDTQSIRERFLERGFKEAKKSDKADLCLINTCTVTSSADRKSRNRIRSCIKENPEAKVIVTGCLAQKDSRMLSGIKGVDFIISKAFFCDGISNFTGHTRAFLKIQDGCDNFCSYCKVPLVRGRSRSRPLNEIIKEAEVLAAKGFKEVVLTGICLGAYGQDLRDKPDLVDVIFALEKIDAILRIRLSSIEAKDVTNRLIHKMAKTKKLCPHLHIPIQSGDDEILKKMKRKYSRRFYVSLINKIKKNVPDVSITTDCLVGFPGESAKNFRNSLSLIKQIMPLKVHIFPYSHREGTYAGNNYKDIVGPGVIKTRVKMLQDLAGICAVNYKNKFLNKKLPVLFESLSKEKKGHWEGYTHNYIKVYHRSRNNLRNKVVNLPGGRLFYA